MTNVFRNICSVSGATVLSRMLGFVRDTILFSFCGIGIYNSAFIFAFTMPNLLRKFLGEGAMSSAVIPVFSEELKAHDEKAVFSLFNHVLLRVFLSSFVLTFVMILCCFCVLKTGWDIDEKFVITLKFMSILMPYMIFICLSAIASAVLNVLGKFLIPAITSLWLNIAMIVSVTLTGLVFKLDSQQTLYWLCYSVVLAGFVQFLVPMLQLYKMGWRLKFFKKNDEALKSISKLFWPGVVGAVSAQTNMLVMRVLGLFFNDSAVSILYLANRITDLPVGIFSSAIVTVFFPNMSKAAAVNQNSEILSEIFNTGIFLILWILLPATIGILCVKKELLVVFFEWGNFNQYAVADTLQILSILTLGIPFSGVAIFLIRSFHSIKNTRTPVIIGCSLVLFNICLTYQFMKLYGLIGMAWGSVIYIIAQTVVLNICLIYNDVRFRFVFINKDNVLRYFKLFFGCFLIFFVSAITKFVVEMLNLPYKLNSLIVLTVSVLLSVGLYFVITFKDLKACKIRNL